MNENLPNNEENIKKEVISLYQQIKQKIQKENSTNNLNSVTYYKKLILIQNDGKEGLEESDIFVARMKGEKDRQLFEVYKNNILIAKTDEDGKLQFTQEYIQILDEEMKNSVNKPSLVSIVIRNSGKEQLQLPEEMNKEDKYFSKEELELSANQMDDENNKKEATNKSEDETIEKIARKTGMQKEDLLFCEKINPKELVTSKENFENIAGIDGKYESVYIIPANRQTNKNSKFAFIGITPNGDVEYIENLKTLGATVSDREVISADRTGDVVKEKQTTEMFYTDDPNKRLSVTVGQYGKLEVDYIRMSREENKGISVPISTSRLVKPTPEMRQMMSRGGMSQGEIDDAVRSGEEQIDENGSKETNATQLDANPNNDKGYNLDEILYLHSGQETTLRQEAEKLNMDPEEYLRRIEKAEGDCVTDKIEQVKKEEENKKGNVQEESENREDRGERRTPEEIAMEMMERRKNSN